MSDNYQQCPPRTPCAEIPERLLRGKITRLESQIIQLQRRVAQLEEELQRAENEEAARIDRYIDRYDDRFIEMLAEEERQKGQEG